MLQAAQGCPGGPGRRHEGQVHWRLSLRGRGALREEVVVAPGPIVLALVICGAAGKRMSGRRRNEEKGNRGNSLLGGSPAGLAAGGLPGANFGAAPYQSTGLLHGQEFSTRCRLSTLDLLPSLLHLSPARHFSKENRERLPRCHPLPTKPIPSGRSLPLGSTLTSVEGEGPVGDELAWLQAVHQRPHPARAAEEGVAPGAQRAQLLHPPFLGTSVLEPDLKHTRGRRGEAPGDPPLPPTSGARLIVPNPSNR